MMFTYQKLVSNQVPNHLVSFFIHTCPKQIEMCNICHNVASRPNGLSKTSTISLLIFVGAARKLGLLVGTQVAKGRCQLIFDLYSYIKIWRHLDLSVEKLPLPTAIVCIYFSLLVHHFNILRYGKLVFFLRYCFQYAKKVATHSLFASITRSLSALSRFNWHRDLGSRDDIFFI